MARQIPIGGRAYWSFPGRASAGPGTRCSVADVDGTVTLVDGGRTVRVVRDDGRAHLVEALELVWRALDGCGAQVVGELVGVARAQDHRGDGGLRRQPRERNLRLVGPLGHRDLLDHGQDAPRSFLLVAVSYTH